MDQEVKQLGPTLDLRYGGIQRLYGLKAFEKLKQSHVLVIGLGGVGSWIVEALARSGVGQITLVDFDDICVSNTNRQIHALQGEIGKLKSLALKERCLKINPEIRLNSFDLPYDSESSDLIFSSPYDLVIDAIDDGRKKFDLVLDCKKRNLKQIVVGAAGGRKDPTKLRTSDLSSTQQDQLLAQLRYRLRHEADFPRSGSFNIGCVYSIVRPVYANEDMTLCLERPTSFKKALDCHSGFGTATHLTGSLGFMATHLALEELLKE